MPAVSGPHESVDDYGMVRDFHDVPGDHGADSSPTDVKLTRGFHALEDSERPEVPEPDDEPFVIVTKFGTKIQTLDSEAVREVCQASKQEHHPLCIGRPIMLCPPGRRLWPLDIREKRNGFSSTPCILPTLASLVTL